MRSGTAVLAAAAVAIGCSGGGSSTSQATSKPDVPAAVATGPPRHARTATTPPPAPATQAVARPRIVQRPIPFGRKRKRETAAYAKRHYGLDTYRLTEPHVIVEHYTAGPSFSSAYNTFAADTPDVELHELPGVCSHFVIDTDGTIYQLVPLGIICRHTVGLNYTAIGIEHVGNSDSAVLGNPRVLRASLKLTRWLRCTYGIKVRDVIGHNESLSSPYHHERVARLRNQTHGDMQRASMRVYRSKLGRLGCG
jgi:N-acetylmuramoyl-L-alanine amidase